MQLALSEKDLELLVEALDSHVYWQLSDHHYRNNADIVEPGSDDPEQASEIQDCVELSERLRALRSA